ncbi:MAG: hypothetical protein ACK5Y2_10480 [Bdellovibrionales bacterium]
MKLRTIVSLVLGACVGLAGAQAQARKSGPVISKPSRKSSPEPRIVEVLGDVENLKTPTLRVSPKMLIVDHLHLKVPAQGFVKVKLDEKRTLTAYGPAEFEIPIISWEDRDFPEIQLKSGVLRFEVESHPFNFALKSPLFEVNLPIGETVLMYDPERALAEAMVIQGQMEFRALNAEESAVLTSGQKVSFRGLLEEGEIAYDLLLQGRKIPKGRLQPIEKLNQQDLLRYSSFSEKESRKEKERKRLAAEKKALEKRGPNLCQKPNGTLNECLWKKEGNSCWRSRCVADGLWKDRQKVESWECESKSKLGPCNY